MKRTFLWMVTIFVALSLFACSNNSFNDEVSESENETALTIAVEDTASETDYDLYEQVNNEYSIVCKEVVRKDRFGEYWDDDYGIVDKKGKFLYDMGSVVVCKDDKGNMALLYIKDFDVYYSHPNGVTFSSESVSLINKTLELVELPESSMFQTHLLVPEKIINATEGRDKVYTSLPRFSEGLLYISQHNEVDDFRYVALINTEGNIVIPFGKYIGISNFFEDGTAVTDRPFTDPVTSELKIGSDTINNQGDVLSQSDQPSGW